jgi:PhnB protein
MSDWIVQPYLTFGGRCDEALEFYRTAIGARVDRVMRFNETPDPVPAGMLAPGFENKVMHSEFRVGSCKIMASDGCHPGGKFEGFSLSITVATAADADAAFAGLSAGGQIVMPLDKTFWSPRFGMVVDKFGVSWMVMVGAEGKHEKTQI